MKTSVKVLAAACAMVCAAPIWADKGEVGVRVRALYMNVDAGNSPEQNIRVEDRWIPEVDLSYWFTDNIAAELVLTYPQKHDVTLNGNSIGNVKHLPPTLMLQYHFMPKQTLQPYVGIGLNYTRFSNVNLSAGGTPVTMDKNSTGLAVQLGFDVRVSKSMHLNFDVKKIKIDSELKLGGNHLTNLKIDPWLVGVGVGWRF